MRHRHLLWKWRRGATRKGGEKEDIVLDPPCQRLATEERRGDRAWRRGPRPVAWSRQEDGKEEGRRSWEDARWRWWKEGWRKKAAPRAFLVSWTAEGRGAWIRHRLGRSVPAALRSVDTSRPVGIKADWTGFLDYPIFPTVPKRQTVK